MRGPADSARTLEVMVVDQRMSSTCSRNSLVSGKSSFAAPCGEAVEEADGQVVRRGVHLDAEGFVCAGEKGVRQSSADVNVHSPHVVSPGLSIQILGKLIGFEWR